MNHSEKNTAMAAGYSATKIHWQYHKIHGVQTACRKRLSYSGDDNQSFFRTLKNYPDLCCKVCANKFKEYVKQKIKS